MAHAVRYICTKCGAKTSSFTGKPPAKWNLKCPGNAKTGLHVWVKDQ